MGHPVLLRAKPVRRYVIHDEFDQFCQRQQRRLKNKLMSRSVRQASEGDLVCWDGIIRDEVTVERRG